MTLIEENAELGRLGPPGAAAGRARHGSRSPARRDRLAAARAAGYERLHLFTFSDLRAARSLYLSVGFEVTSSEESCAGAARMEWQRYELAL